MYCQESGNFRNKQKQGGQKLKLIKGILCRNYQRALPCEKSTIRTKTEITWSKCTNEKITG